MEAWTRGSSIILLRLPVRKEIAPSEVLIPYSRGVLTFIRSSVMTHHMEFEVEEGVGLCSRSHRQLTETSLHLRHLCETKPQIFEHSCLSRTWHRDFQRCINFSSRSRGPIPTAMRQVTASPGAVDSIGCTSTSSAQKSRTACIIQRAPWTANKQLLVSPSRALDLHDVLEVARHCARPSPSNRLVARRQWSQHVGCNTAVGGTPERRQVAGRLLAAAARNEAPSNNGGNGASDKPDAPDGEEGMQIAGCAFFTQDEVRPDGSMYRPSPIYLV